jgi:hypothetical protein
MSTQTYRPPVRSVRRSARPVWDEEPTVAGKVLKGLLITGDGWEYNLVLAAIGVMFGVVGAGDWSLDRARGITHTGFQGGAFALGGGLLLAALLLAVFYRPPAKADKASDES